MSVASAPSSPWIIATRESRLALWQAEHVRDLLQSRFGRSVDLLGMTTQGDQILDRALSKVGGKGLFVKELEVALEVGRADLAVHSLKDVPMELPAGFVLAAVLEREDPRDALVSPRFDSLEALPEGAVVVTSSLRRLSQLRTLRPDLRIEPLLATSTPDCANSTRDSTTPSCSPLRASSAWVCRTASARSSNPR